MHPPSTSSPMDLQILPQEQPPLLSPVEDISLAPKSYLASALQCLEESQQGPDLFEGSALSGFGLPAVGSALAASPRVMLWQIMKYYSGPWSGPMTPIDPRKFHGTVEYLYCQDMTLFEVPPSQALASLLWVPLSSGYLLGDAPADKEVLVWNLFRTGGSDQPKKDPQDMVECLYCQEMRIFAHLTWSASILLAQ